MPRHLRPPANRAREHRIEQDIVADAYTEEERALGWYCYLEDKLEFPFAARCVAARKGSPLKVGETVEVTGMAPEDDCMRSMHVLVRLPSIPKRTFAVRLDQLQPLKVSVSTREAVADWRYWVVRGYVF